MNEETTTWVSERRSSTARIFARIYRYRSLLRRRWWIPASGLALGLGVAMAVYFLSPPTFVSMGRMIVSPMLKIPEGSVFAEELSNFLGTQAALMQSDLVINRAMARVAAAWPNLASAPVELQVVVLPKTTIFVLRATGSSKEYTQYFLQACMDEYVNLKKEMRLQTSDTTLAGLTEELLRLQRELRKFDEELVAFQTTNSVVLLQEQGNSAGSYLAMLNQKLAALKFEYDLLKTLTLDQTLERQDGSLPMASVPVDSQGRPAKGVSDENYLKVKQQLTLLKAEQAELGQYLRPKHPKMIALSEEIARRERLLDVYRQQSAAELENRKRIMEAQIQALEKETREWDAKNLEISRKTAEYQKLKANAQRVQALYDKLLATMQTLDVNKEISPETVTIIERATPAVPEKHVLRRMMVFGMLTGLGAAIALLLLLDRLDDRMNSVMELKELFDENVLGQVPLERVSSRDGQCPLLRLDDDRHSFVEAFRNLRSSLLYLPAEEKRMRVLLVTSATPDEGKSLTAANLAITMASAGSRVLLVDADLRKGILHKFFDLPETPGLSETLSQGKNWAEAVRPTSIPNLFLLPRGATTHRSSELFLQPRTAQFLKEITEKYDYVFVDSVPVMAADDPASLAPHVDGVIFVVRAEQTSARVARAALELLYQRQARLAGMVFNGVSGRAADYYYYHKYKDYYKPYPTA